MCVVFAIGTWPPRRSFVMKEQQLLLLESHAPTKKWKKCVFSASFRVSSKKCSCFLSNESALALQVHEKKKKFKSDYFSIHDVRSYPSIPAYLACSSVQFAIPTEATAKVVNYYLLSDAYIQKRWWTYASLVATDSFSYGICALYLFTVSCGVACVLRKHYFNWTIFFS